jgi:hypothetical protein
MITINGGESRTFRSPREVPEPWLAEQIARRQRDGHRICVQVHVRDSSRDMILQTSACSPGGGGRAPNQDERVIFDLWNDLGLNMGGINLGKLIAFFNRLGRFMG